MRALHGKSCTNWPRKLKKPRNPSLVGARPGSLRAASSSTPLRKQHDSMLWLERFGNRCGLIEIHIHGSLGVAVIGRRRLWYAGGRDQRQFDTLKPDVAPVDLQVQADVSHDLSGVQHTPARRDFDRRPGRHGWVLPYVTISPDRSLVFVEAGCRTVVTRRAQNAAGPILENLWGRHFACVRAA
jgi:hypothetical protein